MIRPLQVLLVADRPEEAVLDVLRRAGYDPRPHYVATAKALGPALERRAWDVVLVIDTGEAAGDTGEARVWDVLGWLQRHLAPPPLFVLTTDSSGADVVALFEGGVRDVIPMAHLDRLGVAVARALRGRSEAAEAEPSRESAFYALAEHMPVGLYRSTDDARILYANPALARMLGCASVEDLLGEAIVRNVKYPRDDFQRQIEATGEVRDFEMRWRRADGHEIVTRETARAVYDADGTFLYFEGTMEDVTEERRALDSERARVEQLEALVRFSIAVDAAQNSDDLYRAVIRVVEEAMQADVAVLVSSEDGEFDIQAWSRTIPYEEVQACRAAEVWSAYALDSSPLLVRDEQTVEGPRLVAPLRAFMRRAGLRGLGSFPLLHRGRPLGALVVFLREPHTFSEGELRMAETLAWHVAGALSRWQAEAELRDSEATLRTITDTTGHVPYRLRFGAEAYDLLSPSVERLTGYAPDVLHAAGGLDALSESVRVFKGAALKEGRADAASHYLALHHLRTAQGELRWVEDSAYPWIDENGQVIGLLGVLQDVTERHEREAAAHEQTRRSLAQQRALNELSALDADADTMLQRAMEVAAATVETNRAGLWLLDDAGEAMRCHVLYNLAESRHHEADAPPVPAAAGAAVLGAHRVIAISDLSSAPSDPRLGLDAYYERDAVRAVLTAPIRQQGRVVGFVSFEHAEATRTWTLDEQDFAGAVADLAALALERRQRAQAEAALRESERRYRAISALAADYAYALRVEPDGSTRLEWATDAFERISGYAPHEVSDGAALLAVVHPEDRRACLAAINDLKVGETTATEIRIVTKSGQERWVCHRSRLVRDGSGRVRHIYSTGQDITDRKRFEEALVVAREEAETLARNKSAFLANMSHEIRTPLTGIIGFAGVLAEEVDEEHRDFVHLIERSGRRLLDTINSVLDLAQLESEGIEPSPEPLNVVEEARQAVLLLSTLAEQKGLALRLVTEAEDLQALVDPVCLHRIFNNLVGNAIKFTEEGEVCVEVYATGESLHVEVRDSGIGIDAEFLPHLFNEFRQEASRGEQGSGLGLAITKKLVELMGGTVGVESTKGEGSRFTITFPLLAAPAPSVAPAAPGESAEEALEEPALEEPALEEGEPEAGSASEAVSGVYQVMPMMMAVEEESPSQGDGNALPCAPPFCETVEAEASAEPVATTSFDEAVRVLVVTSDEAVPPRLTQPLGTTSVVETVGEARMALDRMTREAYDLVVLDVNLGGKQTGIGVLRVARTLPGYEDVFAVALADDREHSYFENAGFDYCLDAGFADAEWLDALYLATAPLR